jgi:periplasmic divalent cation tolerance protein
MRNKFIIIETTYPNLAEAKNLAKILLEKKLAACVQFLPIKSMYFWQGKIENNREILVKIKTKNSLYEMVEKTIAEHHSYEIPQIFSSQINQGLEPYFDWVDSNIKNQK